MPKITPFLWFDDQAEQAVKFYTSIFRKSKILTVARYPKAAAQQTGRPVGSVMTVEFELDGRRFVAFNGGPGFKFTEAVSLVVECKTQSELDRYWKKLSAGGEKRVCGWVKDKYDLCWQLVPSDLWKWLSSKDPARSQYVMEAVLQMGKLDIKTLKKAYGKPRR
jgi:predicted 3-demethylubiquinone-9 3-methyltransferase (glyoxalase superfamily)